jgi:hypothetical protein
MKKQIKKDQREKTETSIPESSWSPAPGNAPVHSKMDWMEEIRFKSVRGVEIHKPMDPLLHPHSD